MIDFKTLPLTPEQSRGARNYLGFTQAKAADESGLPAHKIKRFEAGNYIPDVEFLKDLRAFYEGRDFLFDDTPEPGAKARGDGLVFPAGVVGKTEGNPAAPSGSRPEKAAFHHMRIAITDEGEMGRVLDLIDQNEQRAEALLRKPVKTGVFGIGLGGLTEESQASHAEALAVLAENGQLFARLFGRQVGGAPKPDVLQGKAKPETHADLLHQRHADAHLSAAGARDAKARREAHKPAPTLTSALFG